MIRRRLAFACLSLAVSSSVATAAEPAGFQEIAKEYDSQTKGLLKQFCVTCHSTAKQEGELDLERFATLGDVRRDTREWLKVVEMLDNAEMPPKDAPKQPSVEQKKQLRNWIERYLNAEALANAGDPGAVVLRRLSNAEYTYTMRDLTGVESLTPAKEFPADSAAGEGFTNTGSALVMSPALLTKYLDAGKEVARHAVLLPNGFRFSDSTTRSDWTNDTLARIRQFYRQHSDEGGGTKVNLQGIVFDTNAGGRLNIEKYLTATITHREALQAGRLTVAEAAAASGVNPKYFAALWQALTSNDASLLLDEIRTQWRSAKKEDAASIAAVIAQWQQSLWRFASVGHIGKLNGPRAWQEPVLPLTARHEMRLKFNPVEGQSEVVLYLTTTDAGDGNNHDIAVWERPRFVAPGKPDLLLKDVRAVSAALVARREKLFASTAKCLAAAAEASHSKERLELQQLAQKHGVEAEVLGSWLDYLGIGTGSVVKIDSHFKESFKNSGGYAFVNGWGPGATPNFVANSSDNHVRIPGNLKPHSVAMHPSPTLNVIAGWQSPVSATFKLTGLVQHAHPECGNGITWSLELRRGNTRQRLAAGVSQGAKEIAVGPIDNLAIKTGDVVSMVVGPRDGNHSCDLTAVDFTLTEIGVEASKAREWSLSKDVSPDVLAGNPHADRQGNAGVWHFYTEPIKAGESSTIVPAGSLLARWQAAASNDEQARLAAEVQTLLLAGHASLQALPKDAPDAVLYRQLSALGGPLVRAVAAEKTDVAAGANASKFGLDPLLFGKHPNGTAVEAASLCVQAPSVIEVRLPADLVAGSEFVASGVLHAETGKEGSVQLQVLGAKPTKTSGLVSTAATEVTKNGPWTSNNRGVAYGTPIIVNDGTSARGRIESSLAAFRNLFPLALCYTKIVPVDEVVTLTLFYREDDHLQRLMLSDKQIAKLNALWEELHFVSHDALTLVDAYAQLMEYATQDADPKVFEPLRKPINDRATAFRKALVDAEPQHLRQLVEFAAQVYRRPLTTNEQAELKSLYGQLRQQELPHEEAFRFTMARLFVSPSFLYRLEQGRDGVAASGVPSNGTRTFSAKPISDWELATRLSYFLWSSQPDDELRAAASNNSLRNPDVLTAQLRRMLQSPKMRRMATEFGCQWLHIYDFNALDEKSEKLYPEFTDLRHDMYEEAIVFVTDLLQRDGSLLSVFNADHTFVNERLAKFYGMPFNASGSQKPVDLAKAALPAGWIRVDGMQPYGRGGVLGMASTLAKQSGASRTSPILRGNWVSEVLLGDKLPKPPKDVPRLPEDETSTDGLTVRQLVERHSIDERCANCHRKIDGYGFVLEGYDAIGRRRDKDLSMRPIDTKAKLPDGTEVDGLAGLRTYLVTSRRDVIVKQFCRKLLGYALGRSVQLSDEPLLADIKQQLEKNDFRISVALEAIVRSQQFREVRVGDSAVAAE